MSDVNVTVETAEEIDVSVTAEGDTVAKIGHPHAASAVTVDPSGLLVVTTDDVQAALAELDAQVDANSGASEGAFVWAGQTPHANTNWPGSGLVTNSSKYFNTQLASSGAQNDSITYKLPTDLAAGTYTFDLAHFKFSSRGIYTVETSTDDAAWTTQGTIDGYASSGAAARSSLTGLTIPEGTRYVRLTMATQNASSSGHTGDIAGMIFTKTGA